MSARNQYTMTLPPDLRAALEAEAARQRRSLASLIRIMLEDAVADISARQKEKRA